MNSVKQSSATETFLGEMYKITKMGSTSLTDILSRVKDRAFQTEITAQINEYEGFSKKIADRLLNDGEMPKEENILTKLSAKIGMAMNTITDSTTSHLAQMVIEGNTMGVTEMTRLLHEHENTNCSEATLSLAKDVLGFLEDSIERTKAFL